MSVALDISGLDCFYGEVQVLHGLSLQLRRGEVHCLLGRNGAGKTTDAEGDHGADAGARRQHLLEWRGTDATAGP